jgi:hypothetical protein
MPGPSRARRGVLCGALVVFLAGCCGTLSARAQAAPETIGKISGDDVSVKGAVSFDVENGRSTAMLASGSEVTVRAGDALIELNGGGEIAVCGPAHFSLLKSGAAITLALDYGTVHSQLVSAVPLTVFTPQVVATPVAIGQGPRDVTVGLDQNGSLCTLATQGAMRIDQQFSGQGLLVPQGGALNLADGQLTAANNDGGACSCQLLSAQSVPPSQLELSVPIHPPATPLPGPAPKPPAPSDEPIYKVYMPPLTFDSASPAPPPAPDPQTILLVREARLEPEVVFRGRVEPAVTPAAKAPSKIASAADDRPERKRPGIFRRLINLFFHRHRKFPACEGAGCVGGS